jgi:effector-binding domain-containing protein
MASEPIAFYLAWRESDCDIAVGCQVEGHVELTGGCEWSDLPAGPAACASHFGPYTSLKETHDAIHAWCRANGHQLTGLSWEAYPTDPGQEPDPAKWQTNVFYALKS